jgi:DNA-binding transcriptional MerR regulator
MTADSDSDGDMTMHKLDIWERQGFDVSGLRRLLQESPESAGTAILRFEEVVQRLVNLETELVRLDASGFETEVEELRSKVTDPKRLGEVTRGVIHLREMMKAKERDGRRRREIVEVIAAYERQGYKMEGVRKVLDGPITELELALSVFEDQVAIIQGMKAKLGPLKGKGRDSEVEAIELMLFDTGNIEEASEALDRLEKRMGH